MQNLNSEKTINRKTDHIKIAISRNVDIGDAGFEKIKLKHRALPEIDFEEISLEKIVLGKKLNFPIIIEAITGGTEEGKFINKVLSEIADEYKIGFMIGSERAVIENEALKDTFKIYGKPPLIIGNLGAVQLNYGFTIKECKKAINIINANAFAFHLNPLQECFQLDGNKNFKNLKEKINEISCELQKEGIKVIVKEVGNGLSYDDIVDLNVNGVDIAGSDGTNWAFIEGMRNENLRECSKNFYDWGNSTCDSLLEVIKIKEKRNIEVIASGGIRNGVQAAKCFAIGADAVGMAMPFLREIYKDKQMNKNEKVVLENLRKFLDKFILELKIAMFLTGSKNINEIRGKFVKN